MTSVEKKIRFGGWNKRNYSEARNQINRVLDDGERVVKYARRKCDHAYQYVEYKTYAWFKGGWHKFICSKCNKTYTTSNDRKANKLRNIPEGASS